MEQTIIIHPETAALRKELEDVRAESARAYFQAEYMQFEEKPLLYSLYETHIGKLEFEEFQTKVQISLTEYETRLVQAYINRNERIDPERIAEQVQYAKMKIAIKRAQSQARLSSAERERFLQTQGRNRAKGSRNQGGAGLSERADLQHGGKRRAAELVPHDCQGPAS